MLPGPLTGEPPGDLADILTRLRAGDVEGPAYHGHPFELVRAWTESVTTDQRLLPSLSRRVQCRLPVTLIRRLRARASREHLTQTQIVVAALARYLAND